MKSIVFASIAVCSLLCFASCKKDPVNQKPIDNAGIDQAIQLPIDHSILSGSAEDKDGQVVAYVWSEVSGPNTATIATNGAASSPITGLVAGRYVFQLLVTDDMGASGIDTVSINVLPANIVTLSLQPTGNPTEVHIWGNSTDREGSTPLSPEIGAAAWTDGSVVAMRALLQFDLSSIPASATIVSAKLTLYSNPAPLNGDGIHANSGTNNAMLIENVVTAWQPGSVKWINQPGVSATHQVAIPATSQSLLDLTDIDVSQLVMDLVKNSNNGFSLRLQTESIYNSRIFCSSKYPDDTKHPKLVIQYE
jgi:hypothetical protein